MRFSLLAVFLLWLAPPALAQEAPAVDTRPVSLSGPRVGVTLITGALAEEVDEELGAGPVISQFGWQFETRLFTTDSGLSGVTEWVPLIGGMEQGVLLPSLSFLVGLRGAKGFEIGVGPNLSAAGAAYVVAIGSTYRYDQLNFPVNLSAVLSGEGVRLSLLTGFTIQR